MKKRFLSAVSLTAAIVAAVIVFAAIDRPSVGLADTPDASDQRAAVTPEIRASVSHAQGPGNPLADDASANIDHLFTPADEELPAFFAAPMKDGGSCIVTSATVLSACLPGESPLPGSITIADDSEGDKSPPFVYGLVNSDVRSVHVEVGGERHPAALADGFYVYELQSATATVDDVIAVYFEFTNGATERRGIGD